ncbi:SpoVR family protein [Shewanella ulleungensis]|jgi:spore cortex formation protein SpoVR/YcgB (stage V sporulation)|uniref:SpoVR family protein n=1 Tax=Shewanella ulleungensis TaxID=2282699 RepID=A0ABQ2QK93_9GAMM|nr:SpoVR family protein [Shewanella ulleungensis]MCL1151745.1 SpoVR family protein [Shewanella ulleungensis]GGP84217.1 SpoVR family protein [Shewanella ulleungensis]
MVKATRKPLDDGPEWTFDLLDQYQQAIAEAADFFKLDAYPNQIEIITAEQMMDAYAGIGMPIGYTHWSFGKRFIETEQGYKRGQMGLAYEIVINSDPCIAYLMEENTITMQALVMAHACYGHNSFFKNNYLFKTWTDASSIIDYLVFAKNYIRECEVKYGIEQVELTLDSCHALMNYGVDRYKRPAEVSFKEEQARQQEREDYLQTQVNDLWRTIPISPQKIPEDSRKVFPEEPQENILYFIEKNAPLLAPWQRELVRIVRKMAQYFYPQKQTQVMNEGWATFWHYTILNRLYDTGKLSDRFMLEFLQSHTAVVAQPSYNSPYYNGINPYALGFAMFIDIRRICETPTDEDRKWFPDIAGSDWLTTVHFAMQNFKDESFISQYLSPKVIRDFKLFGILDDEKRSHLAVSAIHDEQGYQDIRNTLSQQYNLSNIEPNIQVQQVLVNGDRSITLRYIPFDNIPLADNHQEVLKHLHRLWGFNVTLEQVDELGMIKVISTCPEMEQQPHHSSFNVIA